MQIRYVIIKVDDQDKALSFYTSIVGFVKNRKRFLPQSFSYGRLLERALASIFPGSYSHLSLKHTTEGTFQSVSNE